MAQSLDRARVGLVVPIVQPRWCFWVEGDDIRTEGIGGDAIPARDGGIANVSHASLVGLGSAWSGRSWS